MLLTRSPAAEPRRSRRPLRRLPLLLVLLAALSPLPAALPLPAAGLAVALGPAAVRAQASAPPTIGVQSQRDPLPSWREGPRKRALLSFIAASSSGAQAIPVAERIAVFDNDGTLWSEQPLYLPLLYAIDRLQRLVPRHPHWRSQEPYAAALRADWPALLRQGAPALTQVLEAASAGLSPEAFRADGRAWLQRARHPQTGQPVSELVYQPMLELLQHLRTHGFRVYIVTGGDGMVVQAWSEALYGVPPEQVIGTRLRLRYRDDGAGPRLERLPQLELLVDGPQKPVMIEQTLGRRPVLAIGNSDGDRAMLAWTMAGPGPRLALLVHHTDARREWAYDRQAPVGRLDQALDQARREGWLVLDMARDWAVVHPAASVAPVAAPTALPLP